MTPERDRAERPLLRERQKSRAAENYQAIMRAKWRNGLVKAARSANVRPWNSLAGVKRGHAALSTGTAKLRRLITYPLRRGWSTPYLVIKILGVLINSWSRLQCGICSQFSDFSKSEYRRWQRYFFQRVISRKQFTATCYNALFISL